MRSKQGGTALAQDPRVTIGTVHSVKGGEADVVYVFPDMSGAAWREMNNQDGVDAAIRVGYVAITRAAKKVVICDPMGEGRHQALMFREFAGKVYE